MIYALVILAMFAPTANGAGELKSQVLSAPSLEACEAMRARAMAEIPTQFKIDILRTACVAMGKTTKGA